MRLVALLLLTTTALAQERAFVKTVTARETYYVNEPIAVRVLVGVDAKFLKDNLVQLHLSRLDFPVHVRAPWLTKSKRSTGATFALNGEVARAWQARDGAYAELHIERTLVPTRAGEMVLAAPRVTYAWGTKFHDDFVNGRTATDRRDEQVTGEAVALKILALPPPPPHFTGAVGRFTIRAATRTRGILVRVLFTITLRIEGDGNLRSFDTPRFESSEDFHVYGMIDEKRPSLRVITFQITALHSDVTEIPAIPFVYFDTRKAKYHTIETQPIPLNVTGGPGKNDTVAPTEEHDGLSPWLIVAPIAALMLLFILILLRRRPQPVAPNPAAEFRANPDLAEALTGYLATRLNCARAAVITPDLESRLAASGVPGDLASRAAAMVEGLVAARYGGTESADRGAADALVDELERL